jgi:Flp pilus assembly secretin CpaC
MDNRAAPRDFAAVQSVELNTAGSFSVLGLLVKKVAEKFDDVPAGGVGSLGIIGDRDATFDTGVVDSAG